jgi:hypothetical protein
MGERGGKLSSYIIADDIQKLKNALGKPPSIDYLNKKLIKSDLVPKLVKFQLLAFYYAVKKDRSVFDMLIGAAARFFQESESRIDIDNFYQHIKSIDDTELENLVDSEISSIIEDHNIYAVVFFTALLKL